MEETFHITACTLHLMLCHWPACQSVSQSIIGPAAGLLGRSGPGPGRASVPPAARRPPGAGALVRQSVSLSVHHRPLVAAESGRSRLYLILGTRNSTHHIITSAPPLHRLLHDFKTLLPPDAACLKIATAEPPTRGIW